MRLATGARLGVFEVIDLLGVGGMGEVYRARDTRLGRDVALKVLPAVLEHDADRRARFEREARALAALNHPNIATLYGFEVLDGRACLVMELVPGDTLADALTRGPLPADEVMSGFRQLAAALEAAHQRGLVHRDLKPANIKRTPEGVLKVLDFGLAKALQADAGAAETDPSLSPTTADHRTTAGVAVGTPAYMSPEQARGQGVDARADVWALGCVLFEALAGRRAFGGVSTSDAIAAILTQEPDWSALPETTPPALRRAIGLCLRKDVQRRPRSAMDVLLSVEDDASSPRSAREGTASDIQTGDPHEQSARRRWLTIVAASLAGAVAGGLLTSWRATSGAPGSDDTNRRVVQFDILPPEGSQFNASFGSAVSMSPDGTRIVYGVVSSNRTSLRVRRLDTGTDVELAGTEGARSPVISPDGQWVAYFRGDSLERLSLEGGSPTRIAVATPEARGITWQDARHVVFNPGAGVGILASDGISGAPAELTRPDSEASDHRWPEALPNGGLLFSEARVGRVPRVRGMRPGTEPTEVSLASFPRFVSPTTLLYVKGDFDSSEGALLAAPFDHSTLRVTGEERVVVEGVRVNRGGAAHYAVSGRGDIAYLRRASSDVVRIVDETGRVISTLDSSRDRDFAGLFLSPDGMRALAESTRDGSIWEIDVARDIATRLTNASRPNYDRTPVWGPDGRVAFVRQQQGEQKYAVVIRNPDGSEVVLQERDMASAPDLRVWAWIANRILVSLASGAPERPLLALTVDGDAAPETVTRLSASRLGGIVSGDGSLTSDGALIATGSFARTGAVTVVDSRSGELVRVSQSGGVGPRWDASGSTLYYRVQDAVIAAKISRAGGRPSVLSTATIMSRPFSNARETSGGLLFPFPDGKRFLTVERTSEVGSVLRVVLGGLGR